MGRKKQLSTADDEEPPQSQTIALGKKNKKKDHAVDDDEYSIPNTGYVEDQELADATTTVVEKKNKKKGQSVNDDEYSIIAESLEDNDLGMPEKQKVVAVKKNKKKGQVIDDDEYSIGTDSTESQELGVLEKSAQNGRRQVDQKEVEEEDLELSSKNQKYKKEKKETAENNKGVDVGKKGKKGKKDFLVGDDEFDVDVTVLIEPPKEEEPSNEVGSTSKKKSTKGTKVDDGFQERISDKSNRDEEESPIDVKPLKKKSSHKATKTDSFSLLASFDEDEVRELELVNAQDEEADEVADIIFSGKKKKKGSKTKIATDLDGSSITVAVDNAASSMGKIVDRKAVKEAVKLELIQDIDEIKYDKVSTNKMSEKNTFPYSSGGIVMEENEEPQIVFTGKKKSKSKKTTSEATPNDEAAATNIGTSFGAEASQASEEPDTMVDKSGAVVTHDADVTSKKQKKKKKSGRTVQEEEDLDKILAELSEGGPPLPAKPLPPISETKPAGDGLTLKETGPSGEEIQADTLEAETESIESAAAKKKKKKKKEKEKEKKAGAAAAAAVAEGSTAKEEPETETKSKVPEKKVSKQVREMQEKLAKLKEAEEKKRREEEERLRKEEEERLCIEELERQKEEAKRKKKEKEKEKLLKKKQEGKLLTGKQKEEARRLQMMREQFMAQSGLPADSLDGAGANATTKKPKYENKKRRPSSKLDMSASELVVDVEEQVEEPACAPISDQLDAEMVEDDEGFAEHLENVDEGNEIEEECVIEEDEDDWDAKSWDEEKIILPVKSAFAEDEEQQDNEVKKSQKNVSGLAPRMPATKNSSSVAKNRTASSSVSVKAHKSKENEGGESEDDGSENEGGGMIQRKESGMTREKRKEEALAQRSADNLRSPICCILGHVDTGKTKLLDCIRRTNVQEGEAGGITQQIGATYFPMENIRERTKVLKANAELKVPGLLVIDTPGHESFTNLRSRGTSLCDIAILVIDIMHGLEPQTIESINLIKFRKTPFVVALNKVDRLYGWKSVPNGPIQSALKQQHKDVNIEFETRLSQIITELKEQGLNSELYYRNKDVARWVSIVPTSAISGEGIPDLLMLLVQLTQKRMTEKLMFISEVECTVLEVKVIEGLGTTIDVVLSNGVLHEGDQIVVCGMQTPIVTNIRALLTPHPMKELRVKGAYQHHKELKAAQGIKITAQGLDHAIAGTQLYVVGPDDDLEKTKSDAMKDMENVMSRIDKSGEGVYVQASTLGSLEALLEFLKSPAVQIPVSGIGIGPVHKKDVMKASVMLEKKKEYATILAFDVKVTPEARELAEETGVKIFMADIIYHLFDQFKAYIQSIKDEKKKESAVEAVFPCVLQIVPNCVFNYKDPIVLGVDVIEGVLKVGTPICIPSREFISIGKIASIEDNHKQVDTAKKGLKVAIKIIGTNTDETQKMFGRHFAVEDELVSHISRKSIDVLKENYREDLTNDEWKLVVKLKNLFKIQ